MMMTTEAVDALYPHDIPAVSGAYETLGRVRQARQVTCFAKEELRSSDLRKLQLVSCGARI